jgi:hypothetical protein
MESSVVDVSEIEDIELKKQIGKSNHDTTSKTLGRMLGYYNLLGICYTDMGQIQLMSVFQTRPPHPRPGIDLAYCPQFL